MEQTVAADHGEALPGLTRRAGLVRSIQTPEFAGVTFHEVLAKSALNKVPGGSAMPFSWTINPYRGCTHGCVYCFARNTHSYLDLDTGRDFDSQIVVKINVAELVAREVRRPSWRGEHVAMGTNTDPYQRAEGRYRLMPGIISALTNSGTPFSILTKGTLLARDLPALSRAAEQVPLGLGVSLALLDDQLQSHLEPGTPSPRGRLELISKITSAGLPCGVLLAPLLPYLTDSTEQLTELVARVVAAGATGVSGIVLHLRPGTRDWFFGWLRDHRPELVSAYEQLYARGSYAPKAYRDEVGRRLSTVRRRFGLGGFPPAAQVRGVPGDPEATFPAGSMPPPGRPVLQEALF